MKTTKPYIAGLFWIPTRLLVGRVNLHALRKELTANHYDPVTQTTRPVELYQETPGYFAVPRVFGRTRFADLWAKAEVRTKDITKTPEDWPQTIKPWDKAQEAFFADIVKALSDNDIIDLQVNAQTGTGKTVATLYGAAKVGAGPLVIVVHKNRIKELWRGNVLEKKGMRYFFTDPWVQENVGLCQQDQCNYQGKKVVIALAPSLTSRKYPDEFYDYFGMVVVDEVHKMATPTFNYVMGMFSARIHVGLTATRKLGPMQKAIEAHIGEPRVVSKQEAMKPKVYRLLFEPDYPMEIIDYTTGAYSDSASQLINPLVRNKDRQRMLSEVIYWRGYQRNRHCLVISDRTDQLLDFRKRLIKMGVPAAEIGMYVGAHKTGLHKLTGKLLYEGEPVLHFRGLPGFKSGTAAQRYADQRLKEIATYNGIDEGDLELDIVIKPEWYKPKPEEYDHIEKRCSIVLATYGIFDVAIDISRLDWGLEASPRGDVTQPVGRILRIVQHYEKKTPEWYSVFDKIFRMEEQEFLGETISNKRYYKTPIRLEKRRRTSYRKQQAIMIKVDNVAQAIETAQAEGNRRTAAVGRLPTRRLKFAKRKAAA